MFAFATLMLMFVLDNHNSPLIDNPSTISRSPTTIVSTDLLIVDGLFVHDLCEDDEIMNDCSDHDLCEDDEICEDDDDANILEKTTFARTKKFANIYGKRPLRGQRNLPTLWKTTTMETRTTKFANIMEDDDDVVRPRKGRYDDGKRPLRGRHRRNDLCEDDI